MRRREFIAGLGAAACPLLARAQQPAPPVIGYLGSQSADDSKVVTVPFLQGLKETGYVEGQNVTIDWRWANWQPAGVAPMVYDLLRRQAMLKLKSTSKRRFCRMLVTISKKYYLLVNMRAF